MDVLVNYLVVLLMRISSPPPAERDPIIFGLVLDFYEPFALGLYEVLGKGSNCKN